jgi:hypothetical protein
VHYCPLLPWKYKAWNKYGGRFIGAAGSNYALQKKGELQHQPLADWHAYLPTQQSFKIEFAYYIAIIGQNSPFLFNQG